MGDLKILVRNPVTGRLKIGLPRPAEYVDGINLLVQIVTLFFMTNGGRSIVSPGRAGGFRGLLGGNYDLNDPSELMADIRLSVSLAEQMIKEEQGRTRRPPSERLQSLQLIDIVPSDVGLEVEVIIGVVNEERQQAQAVVVS